MSRLRTLLAEQQPFIKKILALEPEPLALGEHLITPHVPEAVGKLLEQAPLGPTLARLLQMLRQWLLVEAEKFDRENGLFPP